MMSEERFRPPFDVDETGKRLNLTPYEVRHAFRRGEIGGFKIGKNIRIWQEEVDRLLGSVKPPEPPAA